MKDVPQGLRAADIAVAASTRNLNRVPTPTRFVPLGQQDTMPNAPQRRFIPLGGQKSRPQPRVQLLSQPEAQERKAPVIREPKRESPRDEVVVLFPTIAESPPAPVGTNTTPTPPVSTEEASAAAHVTFGDEPDSEGFWYTEDVPESATAMPIDVADASQERPPSTRATQVKKWSRVTVAMSAAALAAACTSPSSTSTHSEETASPSPSVSATEHHGPNNPLADIFQTLEKDKTIAKNQKSIDVQAITQQYKKSDFASLSYKDPRTGESIGVDTGSAPVIEVHYNKATGEFTYEDQTPHGLTKEQQYELLLPIMEDNLLLHAAFANGGATRIAVRLLPPGTPPGDQSEYSNNDLTDPKGPQNTIFIYLPATPTVSVQYIRDAVRHESIHAVTAFDPMSSVNGSQPSQEELSTWNAACVDLRDVAITEALQHKQKMIQAFDALSAKVHNQHALEAIAEVKAAMIDGEFDKLQPNPKDKLGVTPFSEKIPDCRAIGPYGAFARILNAADPNYFEQQFMKSNKFDNEIGKLSDGWANIIADQTIYNILREGVYHTPEDELSGHPYDAWDELFTSTCDIALGYPNALARNIRKLTLGQREAVLKVVEYSMKELASQIPDKPSNARIHNQISTNLAAIVSNSM